MTRFSLVLLSLILLGGAIRSQAQDESTPTPAPNSPITVFFDAEDNSGAGDLLFIDTLTGRQSRYPVTGERFTVYHDGVMYFDTVARQVMWLRRDGTFQAHPFVELTPNARRVDWVLSGDGAMIAWTITGEDAAGRLTTRTSIANSDGANARPVLTQVDEAGSRLYALPIAFSPDKTTLYMDNHPDGISNFIAFDQYVGIFALNLATGETELLPGEQGGSCICGAAIWQGLFLRLRLRLGEQGGFDMHIYDLVNGGQDVLRALSLANYDTGGDVLISPDGHYAVYALARVRDFNLPSQAVETTFVLMDLVAGTQSALTVNPITTFVRPRAWTEDNSAILFTSPAQNGTWKITVSDGHLERIADARYIGVIS